MLEYSKFRITDTVLEGASLHIMQKYIFGSFQWMDIANYAAKFTFDPWHHVLCYKIIYELYHKFICFGWRQEHLVIFIGDH